MLFEEADDNESQEIKLITDIFSKVNEKCSDDKTTDRCDHAYEFAKCFDRVIESLYPGNDFLISNDLENKK